MSHNPLICFSPALETMLQTKQQKSWGPAYLLGHIKECDCSSGRKSGTARGSTLEHRMPCTAYGATPCSVPQVLHTAHSFSAGCGKSCAAQAGVQGGTEAGVLHCTPLRCNPKGQEVWGGSKLRLTLLVLFWGGLHTVLENSFLANHLIIMDRSHRSRN